VRRLAASDLDGEARRLFIRWCEAAGCIVRVDRIGNIFARPARPRSEPAGGHDRTTISTPSRPAASSTALMGDNRARSGPHFERARLRDRGSDRDRRLDQQEDARFSPAMVGSGVFGGVFALAECLARPDNLTGVTLGAEFEPIGFAGAEPVGGTPVAAYFEAHIEKGPILERRASRSASSGAQGQRWYEVTVTGQEAHAGPTPMPRRRDVVRGPSAFLRQIGLGTKFITHLCTRRLR
jgi:beta-ureidopropionase / N-carbamoyl-L-amino-acid hydrolase